MNKIVLLKSLLFSAIAVFAPIQGVIFTVGILIFTDLILGCIAAKKRGEDITSAGLRRTVTKMFIYQTVVLTGFLFELYLLGGIIPVAKLCAGAIGTVEFKSILENVTEITGIDFKEVLFKLGSKNDNRKINKE